MKIDRKAFIAGFLSGMAAPVLLYTGINPIKLHAQTFQPLYTPESNDSDAIESDFRVVGEEMSNAMNKYNDQKTCKSS